MSSSTSPVRFDVVALDTPDPAGLARFYCDLLGWHVERGDDDWVTIRGDGGAPMAFQLAPDHVPPTWPAGEVPQQFHLDLLVADYESTEPHALALGATPVQDDGDHPGFRVYADPSGHPFCLCAH